MATITLSCGKLLTIDDDDAVRVKGLAVYWQKNGVRIVNIKPNRSLAAYLIGIPVGSKLVPDHRDMDPLNCRKSNLRAVTRSENSHNIPVKKNNTTGYTGVTRNKGSGPPWIARIKKAGIRYYVGFFHSLREAVEARNRKAVELYGECARLLEPPPKDAK